MHNPLMQHVKATITCGGHNHNNTWGKNLSMA